MIALIPARAGSKRIPNKNTVGGNGDNVAVSSDGINNWRKKNLHSPKYRDILSRAEEIQRNRPDDGEVQWLVDQLKSVVGTTSRSYKAKNIAAVDVFKFWAHVDRPSTTDCWTWKGAVSQYGYGRYGKGSQPAHRVAYRLVLGPIRTDGDWTLDHLCRNRLCVNPFHMEVVTRGENVRRGDAGKARGAQMRARTHCPSGHAYDAENTYIYPSTGHRECRACGREKQRRRRTAS